MFCSKCHHDLGGVQPVSDGAFLACPECGRTYDATDPRTFSARQRSRMELILLRRVAPAVMVGLTLLSLLWYAVIPRPLAMFGRWGPSPESIRMPERSTLWYWLGSLYGTEALRTGNSVSEAWFWNDRVLSVRSYEPSTGEPVWEVLWNPDEAAGPEGVWTMRVIKPVPQNFDLLAGFRATRERLLGIVVGEHDPSVLVEPFEAAGSEADVLSAYIRATRVSVRPIRSEVDQVEFWVFDEELDRLVLVDEAELERRGIEALDRTWRSVLDFGEVP
jgi:hypothetical protein